MAACDTSRAFPMLHLTAAANCTLSQQDPLTNYPVKPGRVHVYTAGAALTALICKSVKAPFHMYTMSDSTAEHSTQGLCLTESLSCEMLHSGDTMGVRCACGLTFTLP